MPGEYDALRLDPLYVNNRRVLAVSGRESISNPPWHEAYPPSEKEKLYVRSVAHARALAHWLAESRDVFPFEVDWMLGRVAPGRIVTTVRTFTFRNAQGRQKGQASVGYADFAGIGSGGCSVRLELRVNPDHVVVGSPGDQLKQAVREAFVVAEVLEVEAKRVVAVPIFVGHRITQGAYPHIVSSESLELPPESIDSFSRIREVARVRKVDREAMRRIPEQHVKEAIARIIGEDYVPKDWGGERSDLFSTNLMVDGRRLTAAFMFKGPAGGQKYHPMTFADLGKNGDQIERLSTEPADVLVLQHCHQVTSPVRATLLAFCNQAHRRRRYCILDGDATVRILRAYDEMPDTQ